MKAHRIWLFIIGLVIVVSVGGYTFINRASPVSVPTVTTDAIGKYAYNKDNGQYRGKIAGQKLCKAEPQLQCYKIEGELGAYEVNIDDVLVKKNLR